MEDRYGRNIDYLRISVTDRCNLRCVYCMPKDGVVNLKRSEILTFEEILRIVKVCTNLKIKKIKVTGGEPLVRKGIVSLIKQIKETKGIEKVTLTTNGVLLYDMAEDLKAVGLDGVNVSLDTINPHSFFKITRRDCIDQVIAGIKKTVNLKINTKINCIPIGEFNGGELINVAEIARDYPIEVRFIELMPMGYGKKFEPISNDEILKKIEESFGPACKTNLSLGNGPAVYYNIPGFMGHIGFISSISHEFCASCNRIRLTADGNLKLCLNYDKGIDLKYLLRENVSDIELEDAIRNTIYNKPVHHNFNGVHRDDEDNRNMFQIGG